MEACGEDFDHVERLTYKDVNTEQWECINCGAEWYFDIESKEEKEN